MDINSRPPLVRLNWVKKPHYHLLSLTSNFEPRTAHFPVEVNILHSLERGDDAVRNVVFKCKSAVDRHGQTVLINEFLPARATRRLIAKLRSSSVGRGSSPRRRPQSRHRIEILDGLDGPSNKSEPTTDT